MLVDTSVDSSPDIVKSLRRDYTTGIGHGGAVTDARSLGVETATTPWLLVTDADVEFSEKYFKNFVKIEDCDLIYGPKLSLHYFTTWFKWFAHINV